MKLLLSAICLVFTLSGMSVTRDEALKFLYSSMPLPDKADYTEKFYIDNIEASLRAKNEMPWGDSVPEREFMHFVLPVRVNNENLDNSRMVLYEELRPRVCGLTMKDAILEVNHWCHEKVTYKPSDGRTSSPLSSLSQAIGRCGEESTFLVAALRSVGIPARQIYTPRWAHTDDNHAWVEAWADGTWYFLGACEPEPVLDLAWFNEPASRGMLMNTNVVGNYTGPEEILLRQPLSTRINVTSKYASVATLPVRVLDSSGRPVKGANVDFCIYNYAEYYPAVTKKADADGMATLTSGLGDVLVWASDGKNFGFAKGNPADYARGGFLDVVLDKTSSYSGNVDFDIIPPSSDGNLPEVSQSQRMINDIRLHREDSIRSAYTNTFATAETARRQAARLGLGYDDLATILVESRGNHKNLIACLERLNETQRDKAMTLLLNVSEKDRRDIPTEVIVDHVGNSTKPDGMDSDVYGKYVLNPRVELEFLRPWRKLLGDHFASQADEFRHNPQRLADWVSANISDASKENPSNLRMSPAAVLAERKADPLSRDIFFVAVARSIGIPARIDPVTGDTQFMSGDGVWHNALFASESSAASNKPEKGKLMLRFTPSDNMFDPKYYSQFSISKIDGGRPRLLEFDEGSTVSSIFESPYELEAGQYILTTGRRLANGGVLAHSEIFSIKPGDTTDLTLNIRHDDSKLSVIGSLNAENLYHDLSSDSDKSIISTTGRGYYYLGLIQPNHEPSAHALNDISAVAGQLEATGRKIVLLFENESKATRFDRDMFPELPSNVVFGIDSDGLSRKEIMESLHLENPSDPVFVVADTFNRIVWVSTGYTIGLGEQLVGLDL